MTAAIERPAVRRSLPQQFPRWTCLRTHPLFYVFQHLTREINIAHALGKTGTKMLARCFDLANLELLENTENDTCPYCGDNNNVVYRRERPEFYECLNCDRTFQDPIPSG